MATFFPTRKERTWPKDFWLVQGREKLCIPCVTKRLWRGGEGRLKKIRSTHSIARDRFYRSPEFGLIATIEKSLDKLDEDSELEKVIIPVDILEKAKSLSPYYSVILFDGDEMGKWFSGQKSKDDWSDAAFKEFQIELSNRLLRFSELVVAQAGNYRASVVYAGGDEGLVFCPLDFCLPFAKRIHELWTETMDGMDCNPNDCPKVPTLSLQAIACHSKSPLQPNVDAVHEGLTKSKESATDRNCFGIAIRPRSGSHSNVVMPWGEFDFLISAIESFSNWRCSDMWQRGPIIASNSFAPTGIPHKILGSLEGLFKPADTHGKRYVFDVVLFKRELLRIVDGGKNRDSAWWPDFEKFAEWLVQRSREVNKNEINGLETVESILKTTGTLAKWLQWKESGDE